MPAALTKVIHQAESGTSFIVMVNGAEYAKWKEGDHTIPLVDVVQSFQILSTQQGAQGILGTASKQELENEFGTSRDDDCIQQILEKGKAEHADSIRGSDWGSTNDSKGSHIDTRGSGRGTSGAGGR
ncbi:DUF1960-domain-containing protein [Peniophora sp. CONT]|nr:DUF1960-domain-containing protein [Peniophora sp. CONT]